MLKIGFDAKRALSNTRGLGNYSRNLIDGLVTYYPENEYFLYGKNANSGDCLKWQKSIEKNVSIINPPSNSKLVQAYWRSVGVNNNIKADKLDIYHGLSHEIPFHITNQKTKYLVTIHDLIFTYFKQNFSSIDRRIYFSKIKYSCQKADQIIAISQQTKNDIIDILHVPEEKVKVLYQSCSPLFYNESSAEKRNFVRQKYNLPENYLLFVGALVAHKNIAKIIEALAYLPENKRLPLIIIGKTTKYKEFLVSIINKENLSEKVKFIEYVDTIDMPSVYQMAKILVWPSLYEGFGIPIIEALFSKLPVITSKDGCFNEAGGESSIYINPESAIEIAESIHNIMENNDLYSEMKQKGFEYAQKFHLEATSKLLMDFYCKII